MLGILQYADVDRYENGTLTTAWPWAGAFGPTPLLTVKGIPVWCILLSYGQRCSRRIRVLLDM